jgi:4-amino-4-deoxy-L-arabinose transferase-like glycosyltransferase
VTGLTGRDSGRRSWLLILGVGAFLRLGLFAVAASGSPSRFLYLPDSLDFDLLARCLVTHARFSRDEKPPFHPEILRTPVYPVFLAAIYAAAGPHPLPGPPSPGSGDAATHFGAEVVAAGLAGVFLSTAAILLVRRAAHEWLPGSSGLLAALLVAFDLGAAAYGCFLLTEALFVVLLLLALTSLGRLRRGRTQHDVAARTGGDGRHAFTVGFLLGLATLCRPIALGLPVALALGRTRQQAVLLLSGAALVVAPWVVRNGLSAGLWNVSSVGSVNLLHHRAGAIESEKAGRRNDPPDHAPGENDPEAVRRMTRQGLGVLARNAGTLAVLTARAWLRTLGPDEDPIFLLMGYPAEPSPWWLARRAGSRQPAGLSWLENALEGAFLLCLYGAALRAIPAFRDPHRRPLLVAVAAALAYFVLVSGPEYYGRFRVPLVPLLALAAETGTVGRRQSP